MSSNYQRWQNQAEMLVNRIKKNQKKLRKWARRENITCYRVYDADIPEVPFAVDWYDGRLHIAEYNRPHQHMEDEHDFYLDAILDTLSDSLELSRDRIFLKRRQRQKGTEQYERVSNRSKELVVEEQGLKFKVNMTDYVDTGLFLDHRPTRALVREESKGKRVLNLFAYTGAFSVYAAAGGASEVTTVDLSNTYLEWAKENFFHNDLPIRKHRFIQSDIFEFLRSPQRAEEPRYDLVIVDPPTFSNSKRFQGVFDIQRDHVGLLNRVLTYTTRGGTVYFSTNFRKFKLDGESLSCASFEEISHKSVPQDFRNKRIHRCWRLVC